MASPAPAVVSFQFVYGSGSQYWTTDARTALQRAADILSATIVVTRPVTLTYTLVGNNSPNTGYLATAWAYWSNTGPGYYAPVVQNKILTGVDSNGSAADGLVVWNFGYDYDYGYGDTGTITGPRYDFTGVALHELLHTFGFISGIGDPSNPDTNWTTYYNFLVTANGTKIVGSNYIFDTTYYANLTGNNGGVYFGGTNAVQAYGGLVPLYTPGNWSSGSSLSHLGEDNHDGGDQVMNPWIYYGTSPRTVSSVEAGMLKDLGYTVNSVGTSAFAFLGFGFLRRKLRGRKAHHK